MPPTENPAPHDELSSSEIEEAYQQALEAISAAEAEVGRALSEVSEPSDVDDAPPLSIGHGVFDGSDPTRVDGSQEPTVIESHDSGRRIQPKQIIEAALFVGGMSLTARRLATLLRGDFDTAFVERTIDDLNQEYEQQRRPCVIELREGGYQLHLKSEFTAVQQRVFNMGPREVRLSQDALELLALVAYNQPITRSDVEQTGRRNGMTVLRQLIRRQLVAVERNPDDPQDIRYRTSERFLQVFGLNDLSELPQAELLDLK